MSLTEITCACERCKGMCAGSTCLPTPDEARRLIRAGYATRLATYHFAGLSFVGPAPAGREGALNLTHTRYGACTFFREGLCELHDKGLKPLEGRIAHHDRHWLDVRLEVEQHWRGRRFDSVLAALRKKGSEHGL